MHLIFELLVDVPMVEVSVSKKPVQPPDNIVQVLFGILGDGHSVKIIRVDYGRWIIQIMNHVVNCTAVVWCAFVRGTYENEFLIAGHLGAGFRRANTKQLYYK